MSFETTRLSTTVQNLKPSSHLIAWRDLPSPGWATAIGVLVLFFYVLLLPFIARTWRTTGDEPHYLLAAHSLVTDWDFDLSNNYAQFDYLNFYLSKDIVPQIRLTASGQQILDHYPGLPLLIAPAYAWGGRFGVLIFQAILGGLLAAVTFKLARFISQNVMASLVATFLVILSPPLLMYHYLIYPELLAALLVTTTLYYALTRNAPTFNVALWVATLLAILPWLNRRFMPLTFALALLLLWSWRKRELEGAKYAFWSLRWLTSATLVCLFVPLISGACLLGFNSQLSDPIRADFINTINQTIIWSRIVRGSVGWLIDQQRGLLIYAPIYILALWGLPILVSHSLKQDNRHWAILLPFGVSLGGITLAGGFWFAWELGPRFLVVSLPALTPLLALAWRDYGQKLLFVGFASLLFGVSLLNSWLIIQNPELPYKSSLPLYYSQKLDLPLTEILPDLANHALILPMKYASDFTSVPSLADEMHWFAPVGTSLNFVNSKPLVDLPYGHYVLSWPLQSIKNLPADTQLARISINYLGGGQLLNHLITAADLPTDGSPGIIEFDFLNPNVDRWRTPMILRVTTTGQAEVWAKALSLTPNPFYAYFLAYFYLIILLLGSLLTYYIVKPDRYRLNNSEWRYKSPYFLRRYPDGSKNRDNEVAINNKTPFVWVLGGWFLLLGLLFVMGGYLFYNHNQSTRTYQASELAHLVGQFISDPAANKQQAWRVDPAVDPPQKAIYGPFDIYDAGQYQVTFRIKLPEAVDTGQEIVRLQVNATANFDPLITQAILSQHFTKPDLYHDMVLTIDNPRRQALSFDLHYLGLAPLLIDQVTITKVAD